MAKQDNIKTNFRELYARSKSSGSTSTCSSVRRNMWVGDDYFNSSNISAITLLAEDFVSSFRLSHRRLSFKLHSLVEQKRTSDPNPEEFEECLDSLRGFADAKNQNRFSNCSNSKPMAMPRRIPSENYIDFQTALQCDTLFLEEEEDTPFSAVDVDGYGRTSLSAQSLDLADIFGDQ